MISLPLQRAKATAIGDTVFSFATENGRTVYFSNLEPFDCHAEGDRAARLLRIARFARHGVRHKHLMEAFGVGRTTVHRAQKRLAEDGERSFHAPRRGRGASVLVGETAAAERLLASGMSGAAAARELGVSVATMNHNRRKGRIGRGDGRSGSALRRAALGGGQWRRAGGAADAAAGGAAGAGS